jgi:TolA-binding protein
MRVVAWCFVLPLAACGPSMAEQELKTLTESVHAMQAHLARLDARVEDLGHRVFVMTDRVDSVRVEQSREPAPPPLSVVRLSPAPAPAPEPEPEDDGGPVVEIKLDGSGDVGALRVVDVPPPPETAGSEKNAAAAEEQFRGALAAYQAGKAAEAHGRFGEFVRRFPNHDYADNAQYWMGECQM